MLLLEQMIILFLLMAVGFYCYKKGIITDETSKKISAIVVNIANPAMILTGCMSDEKIEGRELLMVAVIVVTIYVVLMLLATCMPHLLRVEKRSRGTYRNMTIFSNIGFMGFPVIAALYGSGALLYASLFTIPFNVLIYTYGIAVMLPESEQKEKQKMPLSRIFNVGVIACIITIIVYLLKIPVPAFIKSTTTHLSNLTAPLSMMVIGASMATMDLKKMFADVKLLIFSVIKLLVIPLVGVLIIRQFVDNPVICGVCMIMLATPVGSMTAMLAQQYDGDYEMASRGVALTTVLSVVTMPLVSMILG